MNDERSEGDETHRLFLSAPAPWAVAERNRRCVSSPSDRSSFITLTYAACLCGQHGPRLLGGRPLAPVSHRPMPLVALTPADHGRCGVLSSRDERIRTGDSHVPDSRAELDRRCVYG